MKTFSGMSTVVVILVIHAQLSVAASQESICGPRAVFHALSETGYTPVDLIELVEEMQLTPSSGCNFGNIQTALNSRNVKTEWNTLTILDSVPNGSIAIWHVDGDHFVFAKKERWWSWSVYEGHDDMSSCSHGKLVSRSNGNCLLLGGLDSNPPDPTSWRASAVLFLTCVGSLLLLRGFFWCKRKPTVG